MLILLISFDIIIPKILLYLYQKKIVYSFFGILQSLDIVMIDILHTKT